MPKTHELDYELIGDDMQAVVITLDHNESVQAESGAMMYMTAGIEMATGTQGGVMKGLKRALAGESFFITSFTSSLPKSKVCFAASYPGKIIPVDLAATGTLLCQRNSYLCSAYGIDISIAFTKKMGAGFFGGEGFILQKLSGEGLAFIHAGGTVIKITLGPQENLRVDTGCLVAFQESVHYDIKFVGGVKTALFGGEGLFFASLTGPGDVYLQTLPFSRMADRIVSSSMGSQGQVSRGGQGLLGSFLGGRRGF